jgi:uncharacterized protein (DUF1501 family)
LMDDLRDRGRLDETLVVIFGEFGRTPKLSVFPGNTKLGRDHWPFVFSAAFAGAGVQGGQVIGSSDRIGAYPATNPIGPRDFAATIFDALGIGPETTIHDRLGRPLQVCSGEPMRALYSGAAS